MTNTERAIEEMLEELEAVIAALEANHEELTDPRAECMGYPGS